MKVVKGTIQKVNVKEPKEGKFGKYAAYGGQVNDTWYNGLCNERNGEIWPLDKNNNKMVEGVEVELLLEEKNGYESVVNKSSTVLATFKDTSSVGIPQQEKTEEPVEERSVVPVSIWLNCLESATRLANGVTITVKDKDEAVETGSLFALRVAQRFYEEALKIK